MDDSIPTGICKCGCGEKTAISDGSHNDYRRGHSRFKDGKRPTVGRDVNPSGLCLCGCGQKTPIATSSCCQKGRVKGQPVRFVGLNHYWVWYRKQTYTHKEEDRGHETPCWIWQGPRNGTDYGRIMVDGQQMYAHRHYYEARHGTIPPELEVDHLCGVTPCVNPDHLEAVTHLENVRRSSVHRRRRGRMFAIRHLGTTTDMPQDEIAEIFGVSSSFVSLVIQGKGGVNLD